MWAAVAQRDLKQIMDYIAIADPDNALSILQKIKLSVSGLHALPSRGRIVPELKEQGIHIYRELVLSPWRVVYRISDTTVFVVSVLDSRRNVEDVLLDRLIKE
jgi:plasmid stabilization system protein ParE